MKRDFQELMKERWDAMVESGLLSRMRAEQTLRRRRVVLAWERHGGLLAPHGRDRLKIDPLDGSVYGDDEAPHELRYVWAGKGSRRLATGSVEELKAHAEQLLSNGGPYGGPARLQRCVLGHLPPLSFDALDRWENVEVASYGAGWQLWLRPVSTSRRCLVQVSPTGTFRLVGFGSTTNMTLRAGRCPPYLGNDEGDTICPHEVFQVRVGGVPTRLLHAVGGPIIGWATTELGDVFLVLLGSDDLALVLLIESDAGAEGGELRVLRRGSMYMINDLELAPGIAPAADPVAKRYGPINPTPELCTRSIEGMVSAAKIVRDEGKRLVRAAVNTPGMRFARVILRSIFALHESGRRTCSAGSLADLLGDFVRAGLIDKLPSDRTYRSAMQWLADEIRIVKRLGRTRWAIHYEEIAKPSAELCAEIKDSQRRAAAVDATEVPRAEAGGRPLLH